MEHLPAPSRPGTVVLDIGGDVGAAIVHTPPSLAGAEIEIRRPGHPWKGRHAAVRARHVPTGVIYAAVFDSLERGDYELRLRHGDANIAEHTLNIEGGQITETHFPMTRSQLGKPFSQLGGV